MVLYFVLIFIDYLVMWCVDVGNYIFVGMVNFDIFCLKEMDGWFFMLMDWLENVKLMGK